MWHSPNQDAYITISVKGHKENYLIRSKAIRRWIGKIAYDTIEVAPTSKTIEEVLIVLEGKAVYDGPECNTYLRVAEIGDSRWVYVDLGSEDWRSIEISENGWKIVTDAPVKFIRNGATKQLPIPEKGESWDNLWKIINVSDEDKDTRILIVAWLIQAYWTRGPYSHICFVGEQGSLKSSATKYLKRLVDPSEAELRKPPHDVRDLMISARKERIYALDNLSSINSDISDALCSLSTGGALTPRSLYANDEEYVLSAKLPCVMNGIGLIITRGDLLDRTIIRELPTVPKEKRLKESEINKLFKEYSAGLLGLILDATSMGLKWEDDIKLDNLPRMADFASWVVACEKALPWNAGEFIEAYQRTRKDMMVELLDADRFADAIREYLKVKGDFMGTASELLNELNTFKNLNGKNLPEGWPKAANKASNKLTRIAPLLRAAGIEFERSSKNRTITLVS